MPNTARAIVSFASPNPRHERLDSEEALACIRRFLEDQRMRAGDKLGSFADFEKGLHAKIMDLEREVLAEEMARADVDKGAVVVNGITYRRVVRCEETYFTAAGPVRVERTLYKDRSDEAGRAISPMELRLGVVEGRWTPLAAQQAMWVVAQLTPQRAEELFARIGNMTPSKSSLDRLPKTLSARWEEERLQFEKALRAGDVIPQHAATLAVSLDGVLAPMKDGDAHVWRRHREGSQAVRRAALRSAGRSRRGRKGHPRAGLSAQKNTREARG